MRQIGKPKFDQAETSLRDDELDAVTGGGGFDGLLDAGSIKGETECTGTVGVRYFVGVRKLT